MKKSTTKKIIGSTEKLVLLAMLHTGVKATSVDIIEMIENKTGRIYPGYSICAAFRLLRKQGLVERTDNIDVPSRIRYNWSVTASGKYLLSELVTLESKLIRGLLELQKADLL